MINCNFVKRIFIILFMKQIIYKEVGIKIGFLLIQLIVVQCLSYFPAFLTRYYTEGLYPKISSMQRFFFGWIPFPLGDLFYTALVVGFIIWIIRIIIKRFKNRRTFFNTFLLWVNILYLVFNLFWGLNYYKQPFLEQFQIEKQVATNADLFELTEWMIDRTNELRENVKEDEKGVFQNEGSFQEVAQKVKISYDTLCGKLLIENHNIKPLYISWYSELISYLGIGGYYNPFFGTAQINSTILPHDYGMTLSHEIAHQYGFASEKEANYVAFLNGMNSQDIDLQYSVCYNTLWRLLYEVYTVDFDQFEKYKNMISEKVKKDRQADKKYYEKYRGELSEAFSRANSLYLQANGQEGIESYSYYIQLVLNQYLVEKSGKATYSFFN